MNSDFRDLLQLLGEKEVKFLVIGGYAVIHYAEARTGRNRAVRGIFTKAESFYRFTRMFL